MGPPPKTTTELTLTKTTWLSCALSESSIYFPSKFEEFGSCASFHFFLPAYYPFFLPAICICGGWGSTPKGQLSRKASLLRSSEEICTELRTLSANSQLHTANVFRWIS